MTLCHMHIHLYTYIYTHIYAYVDTYRHTHTSTYMHPFIGCLNIHGYIGCLNIHGIHVTTINSTTTYNVFFFVSDLKHTYMCVFANTIKTITLINHRSQRIGQERKKHFASLLIWRQNRPELCKQSFVRSLTLKSYPEKPNLSLGTQISSHRVSK